MPYWNKKEYLHFEEIFVENKYPEFWYLYYSLNREICTLFDEALIDYVNPVTELLFINTTINVEESFI